MSPEQEIAELRALLRKAERELEESDASVRAAYRERDDAAAESDAMQDLLEELLAALAEVPWDGEPYLLACEERARKRLRQAAARANHLLHGGTERIQALAKYVKAGGKTPGDG